MFGNFWHAGADHTRLYCMAAIYHLRILATMWGISGALSRPEQVYYKEHVQCWAILLAMLLPESLICTAKTQHINTKLSSGNTRTVHT